VRLVDVHRLGGNPDRGGRGCRFRITIPDGGLAERQDHVHGKLAREGRPPRRHRRRRLRGRLHLRRSCVHGGGDGGGGGGGGGPTGAVCIRQPQETRYDNRSHIVRVHRLCGRRATEF